jgi:hypothetical protein
LDVFDAKKRQLTNFSLFFTEASKLGTQTKLKKMRTESGVKDTHQMFFIDKIFQSYKKKRGTASKQAALDAHLGTLPDDITSPVWRIKGELVRPVSSNCFTVFLFG